MARIGVIRRPVAKILERWLNVGENCIQKMKGELREAYFKELRKTPIRHAQFFTKLLQLYCAYAGAMEKSLKVTSCRYDPLDLQHIFKQLVVCQISPVNCTPELDECL